ncbi:MAG: GAP family protein [Sphingomonadaceae bacterium]
MTSVDHLGPALAIAASPFGLIPAILLLFTPAARANGGAFAAGWFGGVLAGFLVAAAGSEWLGTLGGGPLGPWLRLLAGLALMGLAARQWRQRGAEARQPVWMASIADSTPARSLRLGLLLSLANPKVLLLSLAGGLGAAGSGLAAGDGLVGAAFLFAAVASLPAGLPLAARLVGGERVMAPLDRARQWLIANSGPITAAVLGAIGLLLAARALADLLP